jgi:hypothetical protein
MVGLPLWAVFAVSFGSPTLSFLGVLFGQWIGRKSSKEAETRSRREETMRTLRWAAELAASDERPRSELGVSQLLALGESDLLDAAQRLFVDAAIGVMYVDTATRIDDAESTP